MCRLTDIEIDILVRKNEALKDEICKLQTENDELRSIVEITNENCRKAVGVFYKVVEKTETAKAEAVKEFAERLKKEFKPEINYGVVANCAIKLFRNTIDYLVKEMTEKE